MASSPASPDDDDDASDVQQFFEDPPEQTPSAMNSLDQMAPASPESEDDSDDEDTGAQQFVENPSDRTPPTAPTVEKPKGTSHTPLEPSPLTPAAQSLFDTPAGIGTSTQGETVVKDIHPIGGCVQFFHDDQPVQVNDPITIGHYELGDVIVQVELGDGIVQVDLDEPRRPRKRPERRSRKKREQISRHDRQLRTVIELSKLTWWKDALDGKFDGEHSTDGERQFKNPGLYQEAVQTKRTNREVLKFLRLKCPEVDAYYQKVQRGDCQK